MATREEGRLPLADTVGVESPPTNGHTDIPKDVGRELRLWHRNETALRPSDDAARLKVAQQADETAKPCGCKPK